MDQTSKTRESAQTALDVGFGSGRDRRYEPRRFANRLNNPVSQRVRTNDHVERTNRMFRFLEKVRYKWRRRRTLVRFVVSTLDGIWRERTTALAKVTERSKSTGPGETEDGRERRPRAA